jgi:L-alanine-DL-glutamate epimerase-like enolase superfamily enzyme
MVKWTTQLCGARKVKNILHSSVPISRYGPEVAIDPLKVWSVMMDGGKACGHGERSVAVWALDMTIWDLAAQCSEVSLLAHVSCSALILVGSLL